MWETLHRPNFLHTDAILKKNVRDSANIGWGRYFNDFISAPLA